MKRRAPQSVFEAGFTLVEVAMALGVFIFAIMGLLGLLPVALQTHQEAKVNTVLAQIQQRLAAELVLTDGAKFSEVAAGGQRNFDGEGRELGTTSAEKAKTVYSIKMVLNGATLPGGVTSASIVRATLYAVRNPQAGDIATTTPTASILVAKAESAP